jgi:hypothetical protein
MTPKFDLIYEQLINELLTPQAKRREQKSRYWSIGKAGLSGDVRGVQSLKHKGGQKSKLGNQQYVGNGINRIRRRNISKKSADEIGVANGIGGHLKIDGINPKEPGAVVNSKQGDMEIKYHLGNNRYKVGPRIKRYYALESLKMPDSENTPFYHGGDWNGKGTINTNSRGALGSGAYFTPEISIAIDYMQQSSKKNIFEVKLLNKNPLILHQKQKNEKDPCIELLVKLGMTEAAATKLVEREYDIKGYVGNQIKNLAVSKGYDSIVRYYDDELIEVVIWNPTHVRVVADLS